MSRPDNIRCQPEDTKVDEIQVCDSDFKDSLSTPNNERVTITEKYKNELNHCAEAYAKERDEKKKQATERKLMTPEEIKKWLPDAAHKSIAWAMAYRMFTERNGHWYYYGEECGEDNQDISIFIAELLRDFDPSKGTTFIQYMERKLRWHKKDCFNEAHPEVRNKKSYLEALEKAKHTNCYVKPVGIIDVVSGDKTDPETGKTPIEGVADSHKTDGLLEYEILETFYKFSDILHEQVWMLNKLGRKEMRERFCVFYTRNVVKDILPEGLFCALDAFGNGINDILDQPYIVYIRTPESVDFGADVPNVLLAKVVQCPKYENSTLMELNRLFKEDKLYKSRYELNTTLNHFFGKTNLSEALKLYEGLLNIFKMNGMPIPDRWRDLVLQKN